MWPDAKSVFSEVLTFDPILILWTTLVGGGFFYPYTVHVIHIKDDTNSKTKNKLPFCKRKLRHSTWSRHTFKTQD